MKIWDKDSFWGRVQLKADFKGISYTTLSKECGIGLSTIYNLRSQSGEVPKKPGVVEKMARILGTTSSYLLEGKEDDPVGLTDDEKNLLLHFSGLNTEQKQMVLRLVRDLDVK